MSRTISFAAVVLFSSLVATAPACAQGRNQFCAECPGGMCPRTGPTNQTVIFGWRRQFLMDAARREGHTAGELAGCRESLVSRHGGMVNPPSSPVTIQNLPASVPLQSSGGSHQPNSGIRFYRPSQNRLQLIGVEPSRAPVRVYYANQWWIQTRAGH